jgi:hypothetical protein
MSRESQRASVSPQHCCAGAPAKYHRSQPLEALRTRRRGTDALVRHAGGHRQPARVKQLLAGLQMSCYPSPPLLYGRGIAAMAGKRHRTLGNLLYRTQTRDLTDEDPLALEFGARDSYGAGTWMNNHVQLTGHPREGLGTTIRPARTCTSRLGSRCALSGRLWYRRIGSRTMMRYNLTNS